MTGLKPAEPSYVAGGRRGQELLDRGRVPEAIAVFEAVLEELGDGAGYGRAVVLERLGRARLLGGDHAGALASYRASLDVAGHLAPTDTVQRLRCGVRSGMGDALRAAGRPQEARRAYLAALEIGANLADARSVGVDQARVGALALDAGDVAEALVRFRAALASLRMLGEPAMEAVAWDELARLHQRLGDRSEAVRHARAAAECERRCGGSPRLVRRLLLLADLLRSSPSEAPEASRAASEALELALGLAPTGPEVWSAYRVLGEIHPERARFAEVARRGPAIVSALERAGEEPGPGRAMLLGRLGRCFAAAGRADLATAYLGQAVRTAAGDDLLAMLWGELGDLRARTGSAAEATRAFEAALESAERSGDLLAQARMRERLGRPGPDDTASTSPADIPRVVVTEETATDFAFDPNLLLDGPRTRRIAVDDTESAPPAGARRPALVPTTRIWPDTDGSVHFEPPGQEPEVHVGGHCTVLRRTTRRVTVSGYGDLVWGLLRQMDGHRPWADILAGVPDAERARASSLVARLSANGVVDLSGRSIGRFIHWATRKGVLPAGGLEGDEAFRLAADPSFPRTAPARRLRLADEVPEGLQSFHALTRARRSRREYHGTLTAEELAALLQTACGVTGSLAGTAGEVKLRAYPSSGALYAVGVYPVVFRVAEIDAGVYRYDPESHALDAVAEGGIERFVEAALPMERAMMAGGALMVCLTGMFPRHECKYGEGGYRMLVAEAGHISANLVLAATALGLNARPFGGVFDGLVDRALGLDGEQEQFLLSVLVGR